MYVYVLAFPSPFPSSFPSPLPSPFPSPSPAPSPSPVRMEAIYVQKCMNDRVSHAFPLLALFLPCSVEEAFWSPVYYCFRLVACRAHPLARPGILRFWGPSQKPLPSPSAFTGASPQCCGALAGIVTFAIAILNKLALCSSKPTSCQLLACLSTTDSLSLSLFLLFPKAWSNECSKL